MEKYSPDAIRLFLTSRSGPSEDIIFNENFLPGYNKFMNKIYQSARFFSIYAQQQDMEKLDFLYSTIDCPKLQEYQEKFGKLMQEYDFLEASRYIHSFFKEWFCDQWIEENKQKIQLGDKLIIRQGILILDQLLATWEPFCPHICHMIKHEFFNIDT